MTDSVVVPEADVARAAGGRLLVVSYHFPPDGAVGGLRWAGLTKHLEPHGWASVVVTAASQPEVGNSSGPVVRSCKPLPTLNGLYHRMRVRSLPVEAGRRSASKETTDEGVRVPRSILQRLRREVSVALAMPDVGRGWILRAAKVVRSLIHSWRPDIVVSSGPPHSAHIATWLATRATGTRWFIDLRDPWAWPISELWASTKYLDSMVARRPMEVLERTAIRASERVIANTRWLADALAEKYPREKIVWLPNGFDPQSMPADRPPAFPGLGITHLGTIYGNRDLVPVVQALGVYLERNTIARADGTKLRVAGEIEASRMAELKRVVRDKGLEAHVEFLGVVPRESALGILLRSRLCIVLAQGQVIEIPAKLYEAIGVGVPAVIVAPKGSAGAAEADRVGAVFVDEMNTGSLVSVFEDAAKGALEIPRDLSAKVSYAGIAGEFLAIVRDQRFRR